MKKLFIASLMGASFASFGQFEQTENLKFTPGNNSFELLISPFADSPIKFNEVKYRHFNSSNSAFRLTANVAHSASNVVSQAEIDSLDQKELRSKSSVFTINLEPGYEHHFAGTERLSPYIGGALGLGLRRTSEYNDVQVDNNVYYVKHTNGQQLDGVGSDQMGYFSWGLNAFAGFDFYVTKNLILGTEFGLGFTQFNYLKAKVKSDVEGFAKPDAVKQGSSTSLAKGANGSIRLGFLF